MRVVKDQLTTTYGYKVFVLEEEMRLLKNKTLEGELEGIPAYLSVDEMQQHASRVKEEENAIHFSFSPLGYKRFLKNNELISVREPVVQYYRARPRNIDLF